jgi:hypothetical protein
MFFISASLCAVESFYVMSETEEVWWENKNAAIIATAGYHRFLKKEFAELDLNPKAYLAL